MVTFNVFEGNPNTTSREMIRGEWSNCTFGTCGTIGMAMMGELLVSTGWEHSFAFFNISGDIRALGAQIEELEPESGDRGYAAVGDYYGSLAAFALVQSSDLGALSALENLVNLSLPEVGTEGDWAAPSELQALFDELAGQL